MVCVNVFLLQLVYQSPLDEKWLASPVMSDDWQTLLINIGDSCDPVNRWGVAAAVGACDCCTTVVAQ